MKLPLSWIVCLGLSMGFASAAESGGLLPRSTPEAQGVASAALLDFVAEAEAKIDALHSVMIVRHGQVIAEGWWAPYAAQEPHMLFSLSKSFTSTAVGLAVAEGKFTVDDPVLKFFADETPEKPSANLKAMRVRDLLTMSTGHHNEDIATFPYQSDESVVKKFLALPVTHKPGTFFVYNTPATYMLSAIVQKTTGQTVLDYLRPRLFEPLGIANPTWEASKQGVSMGGFGLSVRTEDIAKFGQLYLQRGQWQGKQLVPAAWVATATSRWMSNGSNPASDWEQGYGFQFWRCRYGIIRGDGAHGQFCLVLPDHDTVVAMTAGTRDLQGVLNVVWAKLLPALGVGALAPDAAAQAKLREKLASLSLARWHFISDRSMPPVQAKEIYGGRYVFPTNAQEIEEIALTPTFDADGASDLGLKIAGVRHTMLAAPGQWTKSELRAGPAAGPVALSGAWTERDTFTFQLVRYRTPFTTRYQLKFAAGQVTLLAVPNVGGPAGGLPPLVGRWEAAP